jgi:hypothetical protein
MSHRHIAEASNFLPRRSSEQNNNVVPAIMQARSPVQHIWILKGQSAVHTICKAGVKLESHFRLSIASRFSRMRPLVRTNRDHHKQRQSEKSPSFFMPRCTPYGVACQSSSILGYSRIVHSASTTNDPAARKTPSKICSLKEHALGPSMPRPLLCSRSPPF